MNKIRRVKLTIRLDPELVAHLLARGKRQNRGISNTVAAILARAFRLPVPYPDRPSAWDERYNPDRRHPSR